MGVLLRGSAENFDPQIMTEENSLAVKMQKSMALRRKSLELFTRYSRFTSFCYASGRFNKGAKAGKVKRASQQNYDNAYRISYEGALILPAVSMGAVQFGSVYDSSNQSPDMSGVVGVTYTNGKDDTSITTDTPGSIAIQHDPENNIWGDKFNPNDSIALGAGLGVLFIITGTRKSADGTHYVLDGKTVGPAEKFDEAHLADGTVLTEGGNFFGQGSLRGYQRYTKNRWRINYSSIHRYSLTMTGSAKQQKIAWIYNSDDKSSRSWEFDEIIKGEQIFHMQNELALRYSRISMDPGTHQWFENWGTNQLSQSGFKAESGMTAPILGDGWIPQIQDNAEFEYDPNSDLSVVYIEAIMNVLSQRSPLGTEGNTFVVVVDKIGRIVTDKAFKKLIGFGNAADNTTNAVTSYVSSVEDGSSDKKIGFNIKRYEYLGNEIYIMEDELLGNPGLHETNGGITGKGDMFFLNASPVDGISNFEIIARAGREFIRKNVNGMHSFDQRAEAGNTASSGFDGCQVNFLSELMPVIYDARSCGIMKATAKYNGGGLSGSQFLTDNPDSRKYYF